MAYIITSGITSDSLAITDSETLIVSDGGKVNNTTVKSGGSLFVSSGGIANITFVEEATLKVHSGGMASQTKLDGTEESRAIMQIEAGGVADVILVNAYSNLSVLSGGRATDVVWTPCVEHVTIEDGADVAIFSKYSGVYYGDGHALLSSAALIESQTVGAGFEMYVFDGGMVRQTVITPRGEVRISGGRADNTTLNGDGKLAIAGGVATRITNRGGTVEVSSGGVLTSATTTDNGHVRVSSGGIAYNPIASDSVINVSSGGTVSGFTLRGAGALYGATEARLTGRMILSDEAYVYLEHNAVVDFNLSTLTPGAAVRINNFQLIEGWLSVDYTITISGTQADGTYSLAIGFPEYDGQISVVNTEGEVLETISVGETKDIGGTECTLKIVDDMLIFKKGKEEEQPDRPPVVDNGSNDWLYVKKTRTRNEDLANSDPAVISSDTEEDIRPDAAEEIAFEENEIVFHNYVGSDDKYDYRKIRLEKGALLSFSLISTDASKFIIYSLTPGKVTKGVQTYTQKSIQTTTLKKGKETGIYYTANTKPILLEAGEYYIAMQSTAKKKGSAYYNIEVDQDASKFFVKGDISENRTNLKDMDDTSALALIGDVGTITSESSEILADWVGFGDEIDYKAFTLDTAAIISFSLNASDKTKFTIWKLKSKTNKKGVTTYSLTSVQATTLAKQKDADSYSAVTKSVVLDKGTYYFSMESTNAKKGRGGDADYTVTLKTPGSFFFTHTEHFDDNWLYDKKLKIENPNTIDFYVTDISSLSSKTILLDGDEDLYVYVGSVRYRNFAGYGDDTDYAKISLYNDAKLSFTISATDKGKFTIWRLDKKTDKQGNVTYSVKSLQATSLKSEKDSIVYSAKTKSLSLAAGEYYISFESTNASKGGIAYYNVSLNAAGCSGLPAGEDVAEAVPYTGPDAIAVQDALNSAGYGDDALASSVSVISGTQSDAFWKGSALLA